MVVKAIKSITYLNIDTLALALPKSYQIQLAKDIENTIPLSDMMINMYRGEYLSSLYVPEDSVSED